jgi:hypothetical protein
MTLQ